MTYLESIKKDASSAIMELRGDRPIHDVSILEINRRLPKILWGFYSKKQAQDISREVMYRFRGFKKWRRKNGFKRDRTWIPEGE